MQYLFQRRNLSAIELLIGAAFIVVALFAWNQQSIVVDPDRVGSENWRWQLWQIGTLVIAAAGACWFWTNGQSQPRIRCLAMVVLRPRHLSQHLHRGHLRRPPGHRLGSGIDGLVIALSAVAGLLAVEVAAVPAVGS